MSTSPYLLFTRLAKAASRFTGHPTCFALAVLLILVWLLSGPLCKFSDTWQLVINTGTTIITFLMVFLIQSSQNSDTAAMQLKLDELIRVTAKAHNVLIALEDASDEEMEEIRKRFQELAREARGKDETIQADSPPPQQEHGN